MRALIRCRTNLEGGELQALLSKHPWWLAHDRERNVLSDSLKEINIQYPELNNMINHDTFFALLYDSVYMTWIIVNRPSELSIEFRLVNSSFDILKESVGRFVTKMTILISDISNKEKTFIKLDEEIFVFELESSNVAAVGRISENRILNMVRNMLTGQNFVRISWRVPEHSESVIQTGKLVVNLDTRSVEVEGRRLHVTGKEYSILELLSLRKGTTLTKEMFLDHLYGGIDEPELKIIDVFICKLRKKIAAATGGEHYIETVWGRGYVLKDPEPAVSGHVRPGGLDLIDEAPSARAAVA